MSLSSMKGIRTADPEQIACRNCKNAIRGAICKGTCKKYNEINNNRKPEDVYFDNAPCPKYEKGEDLLKYEIQI